MYLFYKNQVIYFDWLTNWFISSQCSVRIFEWQAEGAPSVDPPNIPGSTTTSRVQSEIRELDRQLARIRLRCRDLVASTSEASTGTTGAGTVKNFSISLICGSKRRETIRNFNLSELYAPIKFGTRLDLTRLENCPRWVSFLLVTFTAYDCLWSSSYHMGTMPCIIFSPVLSPLVIIYDL